MSPELLGALLSGRSANAATRRRQTSSPSRWNVMKTSATGHHDLKYFCFVIKLKNVQRTIHYLISSQNSGLLTVPDNQLLAAQREEERKIDQEMTEIGVLAEALNLL